MDTKSKYKSEASDYIAYHLTSGGQVTSKHICGKLGLYL